MPQHVRSIECCYCGGSALLNLRDVDGTPLKCGKCGASLSATKMVRVTEPADAVGWNGEIPRRQERKSEREPEREWKGKREWRGDDDRPKRKKSKGLFDRLEDLLDDIEDIFD